MNRARDPAVITDGMILATVQHLGGTPASAEVAERMSDRDAQWKYLGDAEKTTCEEYTFLRRLEDWSGYDDPQAQRRKDAWHWLSDRLGEYEAGEHNDWSHHADREAYIDAVLHGYDELHYSAASYPRDWMPNGHGDQNVYVKERCYYVAFETQYDAQRERKLDNLHWLEDERQRVWRYGEDHGWDADHRRQRYDNLQIASHYGSAWTAWQGGAYVYCDPDPAFHDDGNWRDQSAEWHESHLGITENPSDSNCDNRDDGIRNSQDKTAGGGRGSAINPGAVAGHSWGFTPLGRSRQTATSHGWQVSRRSRTWHARAMRRSKDGRQTAAKRAKVISSSSLVAGSMSGPSGASIQVTPIHGKAIRRADRVAVRVQWRREL
jgi:hypothetical protein